MNSILTLKNITHIYKTKNESFTALKNINLSLKEREFVAILGPSGCGKSTLLRIITGLQKPTEGEVICKGQPLKGVNRFASIIFQTFALFPWLTVQQNVEIALEAKGIKDKALRSKLAIDLLDVVGLDGFETAFPRELSGGMRQKVGIARALAVKPEILCMDEPFSALDPLSADTLRGEVLELYLEGKISTKTILLVSHNIEEAVFMADRIVIMEKNPGRIIKIININLPHPRNRKSSSFIEITDQIYSILAGQTQPEEVEIGTEPGKKGKTRLLPNVFVVDIIGLLEKLNEAEDHRFDIYKLPSLAHIEDLDKIFELTEALELLGFATIKGGDIFLTALGETFVEASILARKEIFASRITKIPLIKWIVNRLKSQPKKQLSINYIESKLSEEFPQDTIQKQIRIIINWGRYAELFSYDNLRKVLYLEEF
ncbi:ABC transporter ATP-binding protein [Hippea jasoniae]|uniref:ABC transporter ATP-binding protein n=1 Tax=Hippea jasoniae TaxID=944479 RepID=UPI000550D715|nr:nitrate/sulfonate/bicarbonate ABC transporter ATP-binding protein [Hippea jasoniae]